MGKATVISFFVLPIPFHKKKNCVELNFNTS